MKKTIMNSSLLLLLSVSFLTGCSEDSSVMNNFAEEVRETGGVGEEIEEKVITLAIGEAISLKYVGSLEFNGFPNHETLAFTQKEGHLYKTIFFTANKEQKVYISNIKLVASIQSFDYAKGTVTILLENPPKS